MCPKSFPIHPTLETKNYTRPLLARNSIKTPFSSSSSTSSEDLTSRSARATQNKKVSFDKITVRSYDRTVTDNPTCSSGVPIGISWEYDPRHLEVPLESYETSRDGYRRNKNQLRIPAHIRHDMLRYEFDVSREEILDTMREVRITKKQRSDTVDSVYRRLAIESAGNKLLQLMCLPTKR